MQKRRGPIVIVGAGRSGSSLLNRVLDAHPDIAMFGELNGAVHILWQKLWDCEPVVAERERRSAVELARRSIDITDQEADAALGLIGTEERARIGSIVRTALSSLLILERQTAQIWGFQEIWIPSDRPDNWTSLDAVFPEAIYLHITRHPLDFARSLADWHRQTLDRQELHHNLVSWVDYRSANMRIVEPGRYTRLRYEDLIQDAQTALTPFLDQMGVGWHPNCAEPLKVRTKASGLRSALPAGAEQMLATVAGMVEALSGDVAPQPAFPERRRPCLDQQALCGARTRADRLQTGSV